MATAASFILFGGKVLDYLPQQMTLFLLLFRDNVSSIHPSFPPFLSFPILSPPSFTIPMSHSRTMMLAIQYRKKPCHAWKGISHHDEELETKGERVRERTCTKTLQWFLKTYKGVDFQQTPGYLQCEFSDANTLLLIGTFGPGTISMGWQSHEWTGRHTKLATAAAAAKSTPPAPLPGTPVVMPLVVLLLLVTRGRALPCTGIRLTFLFIFARAMPLV